MTADFLRPCKEKKDGRTGPQIPCIQMPVQKMGNHECLERGLLTSLSPSRWGLASTPTCSSANFELGDVRVTIKRNGEPLHQGEVVGAQIAMQPG
jgi:hypothetical protein